MTKPSPWGGEPAELLPCPFCGGKAEIDEFHGAEWSIYVRCLTCSARSWGLISNGRREARRTAIAAWNRRTPSQSPYPPDEGRTHWEGCWRERGHHACAIAKVEALGEREP